MSAEDLYRLVYDIEKMKPACALLQTAFGGDSRLAYLFEIKLWLVSPTPGLVAYRSTVEDLQRVVARTHRVHGYPEPPPDFVKWTLRLP